MTTLATIAGFVALTLSIVAVWVSIVSLRLAMRALRMSLEEPEHTRQSNEAKRTTVGLPHWGGLPYPNHVPRMPTVVPPRVIKDDM